MVCSRYIFAAGLKVDRFWPKYGLWVKSLTETHWLAWPDLIFEEIVFNLFFIAMGEEPGFRGFALPRFLVNRTALAASLIVGILHVIWYIPLFITGDDQLVITTVIIL